MFELPKLAYGYADLEPVIDAKTMEIHHQKHHAAYIAKLNEAVVAMGTGERTVEDLIADLGALPEAQRKAVRNNGGGHYNHSLFWEVMGPGTEMGPQGELSEAMKDTFGSFEGFKEKFTEAALTRFGSGWAWLYLDDNKKLMIGSTANQDNPLMKEADVYGTPIMGLDVWEHAYYLTYQNRRPDYVAAWFGVVNWSKVAEKYAAAM